MSSLPTPAPSHLSPEVITLTPALPQQTPPPDSPPDTGRGDDSLGSVSSSLTQERHQTAAEGTCDGHTEAMSAKPHTIDLFMRASIPPPPLVGLSAVGGIAQSLDGTATPSPGKGAPRQGAPGQGSRGRDGSPWSSSSPADDNMLLVDDTTTISGMATPSPRGGLPPRSSPPQCPSPSSSSLQRRGTAPQAQQQQRTSPPQRIPSPRKRVSPPQRKSPSRLLGGVPRVSPQEQQQQPIPLPPKSNDSTPLSGTEACAAAASALTTEGAVPMRRTKSTPAKRPSPSTSSGGGGVPPRPSPPKIRVSHPSAAAPVPRRVVTSGTRPPTPNSASAIGSSIPNLASMGSGGGDLITLAEVPMRRVVSNPHQRAVRGGSQFSMHEHHHSFRRMMETEDDMEEDRLLRQRLSSRSFQSESYDSEDGLLEGAFISPPSPSLVATRHSSGMVRYDGGGGSPGSPSQPHEMHHVVSMPHFSPTSEEPSVVVSADVDVSSPGEDKTISTGDMQSPVSPVVTNQSSPIASSKSEPSPHRAELGTGDLVVRIPSDEYPPPSPERRLCAAPSPAAGAFVHKEFTYLDVSTDFARQHSIPSPVIMLSRSRSPSVSSAGWSSNLSLK